MKKNYVNYYLGCKIKEIRLSKGLALNEASVKAHMKNNTLCNYESGIRELPVDKLKVLCDLYEVDMFDLLQNVYNNYISYLKTHDSEDIEDDR